MSRRLAVLALPLLFVVAAGAVPAPKEPFPLRLVPLGSERVRLHRSLDGPKPTPAEYALDVAWLAECGPLLYASEKGFVGLAPAARAPKERKPLSRVDAFVLKVRRSGEADFIPGLQHIGVTVFADAEAKCLVYVTDRGGVAAVPARPGTGKPAEPKWSHALDITVRKAGEHDFTARTRRYSMEVYHDHAGNLLYVAETGAIAVVPGKPLDKDAKAASWHYALGPAVRSADEAEFGRTTPRFGMEVYTDENNGNLVYLSETGSVAVVSGVKPDPKREKEPKHLIGFDLGAKSLTHVAGEFYRDGRAGTILCVTRGGAVAACREPGDSP